MLGYGARTYYPIETNPNEGGGPIRRSPLVTTAANAGNMVYRTPHAVVPDVEPGGAFEPQLWADKFLPDGRVVKASALGCGPGSPPGVKGCGDLGVSEMPHRTRVALFTAASGALGGGMGAALGRRGERLQGALWGTGIGLVMGVLASLGGGDG